MPVGHVRINDPKPNPNDNITFIRVLEDRPDADLALKILEALAAQFKPIMKEWGFGVNSLVEYEWNPTFAGRNWNAGEVVEIVLRRRDGSFAPYQFLLYVMCHELAHIREMNHSWAFQKVNSQLRASLAKLRAQRYYGDGFWSAGRSLVYPTADVPAAETELATLTCGGANKKSRGTRRRRRRRAVGEEQQQRERGSAVKLGTTGRQTRIPRRAGGRVSKKDAFAGQGQVLSEDPAQSTFKRRAQAQKAIEARAAAAEARIAAEKRARAAETRLTAKKEVGPSPSNRKLEAEIKAGSTPSRKEAGPSPPSNKKPKIEIDLVTSDSESESELAADDDDSDDVHFVGGGWETDEEDKPAVRLDEDEKRWLASDMRGWEKTFADDGEDVKPVVGESSSDPSELMDGGASKGKSKSKARDEEPSTMRASPIASGSGGPSKRPRKATPLPPREAAAAAARPVLEVDDLTAEERAWLEADMAVTDSGVEDLEGAGGGKVVYMPMPAWMGGQRGRSCDGTGHDGGGYPASSRDRGTSLRELSDSVEDDSGDDQDQTDVERDKLAGISSRRPRVVSEIRPAIIAGPSPRPPVRSFPRPKAKGGAPPAARPSTGSVNRPVASIPAIPAYGRYNGPTASSSGASSFGAKAPQQGNASPSIPAEKVHHQIRRPELIMSNPPVHKPFDVARELLPLPPESPPPAKSKVFLQSAAMPKQPLYGARPLDRTADPQSHRGVTAPRKSRGSTGFSSLKEFADALLLPGQERERPPSKMPRAEPRSDVVLVGLELHATRRWPAATSHPADLPREPADAAAYPHPRPRAKQSPASRAKPYERDSDGDVSTSASSVCSIPSALASGRGLFSLPAEEAEEVLRSFDKQDRYNQRLAEQRRKKREKKSQKKKALQPRPDPIAGQPVNKKRKEHLLDSGSLKPARPSSPSASKRSLKSASLPERDGRAQPARAPKEVKDSLPRPPETVDVWAQAAQQQRAFIEAMDRQGQLWRCRVCEFDNAAGMPLCELCSRGTALAAEEWHDPA